MAGLIRTFPDAGVLIEAGRGRLSLSRAAVKLLGDPGRVRLTSPFIEIEVVPPAAYLSSRTELAVYQEFFRDPNTEWCRDLDAIVRLAREEAERCGLEAMDSFHVAAAHLLGADELVTIENPARKRGWSIHRARLVPVVQLQP